MQGFKENGTLKAIRPVPGVKILGTTTRTEYKVVNGELKKRKVRLCSMGNQQKEGIHFNAGELYAPVIKATELRAIFSLGAKHGLPWSFLHGFRHQASFPEWRDGNGDPVHQTSRLVARTRP